MRHSISKAPQRTPAPPEIENGGDDDPEARRRLTDLLVEGVARDIPTDALVALGIFVAAALDRWVARHGNAALSELVEELETTIEKLGTVTEGGI